MRIVDDETRRLVMENRIDALENDRLFEHSKQDFEALAYLNDQDEKDDAAEFVPDNNAESSSDSQQSNLDEADEAEK